MTAVFTDCCGNCRCTAGVTKPADGFAHFIFPAERVDGAVCSAREASALRLQSRPGFTLVTPGIRPAGSAAGDQVRTLTPKEALAAGSSYLVIGRQITGASDPLMALCEIAESL